MFGFIIKKSFCDGWDNLLSMIITNVIILFAGIGVVFLNIFGSINPILQVVAFVAGIIIICILAMAYGETAYSIADFKGIHYLDFFKAIPGVIKDSIFLGLFISFVLLLSSYSVRYYFAENQSMVSFLLGAAILWIDIFVFLSLQWFIPLRSIMHNNFKKCLKKCFIIFFDNTGFTIAVALYNLVMIAFSVAFIGFFPSVAGILIADTNALRLRLYKYDYLEEHPELTTKKERKQIPWEELIYEDRETLGPRKFRSFLFPWKES